jgi:hypothetical protein
LVDHKWAERKQLEQLTNKELLFRAVRELLIAHIMASRALGKHADALVENHPGETAALLRSLASALKLAWKILGGS